MKCPNCEKEFSHKDNARVFETKSIEVLGRAGWEARKLLTLRREPFPCPNCPAMIKTGDRFRRLNFRKHLPILVVLLLAPFLAGGILFTVSVITGGYSSQGLLFYLSFMGIFWIPMGVSLPISVHASSLLHHVNRWEVASMRRTCGHCGMVVAIEDAEFCPNCGADLAVSTVIKATISEECIEAKEPKRAILRGKPIGTCLVCGLEISPADVLASCPHCGNVFHKSHLVEWVRLKKHCPVCNERLAEREIVVTSPTVRS